MFQKLFKTSKSGDIPQQLYGLVVAQSRDPTLYRDFGVPDTVMGRFDMLALHVFLVVRRLKQENSEVASGLGQDLFDLFVDDLDRALRELGIGDTSVPKKKKKMVRSFYGLLDELDGAMDNQDAEAIEAALSKRVFDGVPDQEASMLSRYVLACAAVMERQPVGELLAGNLSWPGAMMENS